MTPKPYTCECVGGHTDACRQRKARALRGRPSRASYQPTPEERALDLAAVKKVCEADRLPDRYFTGQRMIITRTDEE